MPRIRLPETLDRIRALLDGAAVPRVFLPLSAPAYHPLDIAEALNVPLDNVATALLADADGDRMMAIVPGDARIDLSRLAAALGARHVRLAGRGTVRGQEPTPLPAVVSGLPTLIDRSLLSRLYLFGSTGDPSWVLRLEPAALQRVTNAMVGDIVRAAPGQPAARGE
ncbi:MAG TPA: YbaK/EbsC family protein [Chloroflexota bacterium]|jgi:prolyl-tRNA editing enzyme YbaK/EbsC (Cys-tRNA(Pro) deacylase)|nr:YbaK/EbsC family protein [Chloroflexota bacterium]